MANTTYNLMDDDATLFLVNYMFTKLKTSPLSANTTYSLSKDATNGKYVLTGSDGSSFDVLFPSLSELSNDANYVIDATYVHTDNNYTNAEKTKLAGIEEGAEVNEIDAITVNGSTVSITNKTAAITISMDLANYSNAVTNFQNATQVNAAIQSAIAGITGISFQRVNSYADLPETGAAGTIYLVPNTGSAPNIYDEYIWCVVSTNPDVYGYEKIGTTAVDLSGYVQYSDISTLTNQEVTSIVDTAYATVFGNS